MRKRSEGIGLGERRIRGAGWLVALFSLLWAPTVSAQVVINEIHYDPDVKSERVEFIELYNVNSRVVDLSGWSFTDGIAYTFPAGIQLPGNGYLVIAQDPAAVQAKFGVAAVGPFSGSLNNDGEKLVLRNKSLEVVDEVEYGCGFPWPTASRGGGHSLELIHPALDNNLGGNWRPSGGYVEGISVTIFSEGSEWSYRKGTSEPSSPTLSAWRQPAFALDDTWLSGTASIGYGEGFVNTNLPDMQNKYSTVYFRKMFTVEEPAQITSLVLRARFDDAINVWINGHPVLSVGAYDFEQACTALARDNRGDEQAFQDFQLPNPIDYLIAGEENVIAVQLLNVTLESSDATWDAALIAGPVVDAKPTPGAVNSVYSTQPPPCLRQVEHSPRQPASNVPVTISVKVTSPIAIASVTLDYQLVNPGAYIRITDAEYLTQWTTLVMHDDGLNGDAVADDSVYSVQIPANLQTHRRLVRYRITASSSNGQTVRAPYSDDEVPNFAYFVYDGVPAWTGAYNPNGAAPDNTKMTFDTTVMNSLPAYHLISRSKDVFDCQYNPNYYSRLYTFTGALVYDGEVYDHVWYRIKGAGSTYVVGKNKWKFNFPKGHAFQARDNYGKKYGERWDKLIFSTGTCPWWQYPHPGGTWDQGTDGMVLNEALGMRFFQLTGVPASNTNFVHFRVIDMPAESDPANQYESDFWGLYIAIEQPDGRFLDERDLPDGNLYKMAGGDSHLLNQGPSDPVDLSDLNTFMSYDTGYNKTNPLQPFSWWESNCNLPLYYSYNAVSVGINNADRRPEWNCLYYRNPQTAQWAMLPWDLDLSFEYGPHYTDMEHWRNVLNYEQAAIAYANRARELLDLLFNRDEGGRLVDEYAAFLNRSSGGHNFFEANRAMWEYHPRVINSGRQGRFFANNEYLAATKQRSFAGVVDYMKRYVAGEAWPDGVWQPSADTFGGLLLKRQAEDAAIPFTPTLTYLGGANYPTNDLRFKTSAFADPQGAATFGALMWRLGEVTDPQAPRYDPEDPGKYEVLPVWESPELTTFSDTIRIPASSLKVGHAYRARVRMRDNTGRWSHWSSPIQFVAGEPDTLTSLREHLRVTELMFNPPAGSAFEYVELHNTSGQEALNLSGVALTDGVSYVFPEGTTLGPEGYLLVSCDPSANFTAFRSHYGLGDSTRVYGPYSGQLNNSGERVRLASAVGGTDLVVFEYNDARGWPLASQGGGHSLVPLNDTVTSASARGALDYCGNWRASTYRGGSPGVADPIPPAGVLLNEFAANTKSNDWIELYNPTSSTLVLNDCYLSDDVTSLTKWAIPNGTTIPAGGFLCFDESGGYTPGGNVLSFGLNATGEQVVLSYLPGTKADRILDCIRFKAQEPDLSLGRHPDGGAYWYILKPTPMTGNTKPIPDLVLSEVMYHPEDDLTTHSYVELYNPTTRTLPLSNDAGGWRITGEVGYQFTSGTVLAPGAHLAIVGFSPANLSMSDNFYRYYSLPSLEVNMEGGFTVTSGDHISGKTGRIALERPLPPLPPSVFPSWVVVDELFYFDDSPFPSEPDGGGTALHRVAAAHSGVDPANWRSGTPSPGTAVDLYRLALTGTAGGKVEVSPLQARYLPGDVVSLRAVPETYYLFVRWEGDVPAGQETTPKIKLTMDRDRKVQAVFERVPLKGSSVLMVH